MHSATTVRTWWTLYSMQLNSAYRVSYGVDRWYAAGKPHQWDCVQCACFYTHNPHTPVLGATQVAQRLWSTQHPGRIKQGQTGKALQIFNSSVQWGMSASFNRVCISFVQRATRMRRYTKWKYASWYLLYVIVFFSVYIVCVTYAEL